MPDRESYLLELSERVVPLIWETPPPEISEAERTFICIWQLEAELNNGGFEQYYSNSSGDLAAAAPAALDAIGANHTAGIVRSANDKFPGGPPMDRDAREDAVADLPDDTFEQLDDRFLAYEDNLSVLLFDYVQVHKAEIRGA